MLNVCSPLVQNLNPRTNQELFYREKFDWSDKMRQEDNVFKQLQRNCSGKSTVKV